jgi:CubicO group peptidase (beta-lactamase class C family)
MLFNGNWYGQQLVSESYVKESLTPVAHLLDDKGMNVDYYGWQWWLMNHKGHAIYYMRGINGQYVIMVPDMRTVIVRLGHKRSSERINNIPADVFTWIDAGIELAEIKI